MGKIIMKQVAEIERIKLDSAAERFLRHCRLRNLSPQTIEYYREDLEYFSKVMNLKYLDELTEEVMENFVAHEMDKGNKVTAINSRIRGLRVFIRFCGEREYMEAFKFPLLKEDMEQKEPYTDAELKRLLKRPTNGKWPEWRAWAIINTLLATGIRANTLVNIRICDVDFQRDTIFLAKLKNRKQQTIPMSASLKLALSTYLKLWEWKGEDYLFPTQENTQMQKTSLQASIRIYNHKRGVSKTSLHLFRHTFAKNYIMAGGGMVQLQAILGHSTMDMTRRYINLYGSDVQRDFDRLNPLNNVLQRT